MAARSQRIAVVVPTFNAGALWGAWLAAMKRQTCVPDVVLVIDSGSSDDTVLLARQHGFTVREIEQRYFDHGGTRQSGVDALVDIDIICFLTQDAILADADALALLIRCFDDDHVGVACGRQLPRHGANAIEAHARLFNYSAVSAVRRFADRDRLGLRAAFCSNSFAAYRRSALEAVGGFPRNVIFGEDMWVAARILKAGWSLCYCAEASVVHSHGYSASQEFSRYFDIGVFHAAEHWLIEDFGRVSGEGARFLRSEIKYLLPRAPWLIPLMLWRTLLKLAAYRLGLLSRHFPNGINRRLSMNKNYWRQMDKAE